MTIDEAPRTPTRIGCPACVHRTNLVIDPDCPICHGHGTLRLHPAGLSVATPETIAHTVQIVIEAHARQVEETMSLSEDRHTAMCDALAPLIEARVIRDQAQYTGFQVGVLIRDRNGNLNEVDLDFQNDGSLLVIDPDTGTVKRVTPEQARRDEAELEQLRNSLAAFTRNATTLDQTLPHAHPYTYRETERPHARGLNILSAAGHPSCTARVLDPPDLLTKTWATARHVDKTIRSARILADALTPAIHKRRKATA